MKIPTYLELLKEAEMVAILSHAGQTYDIYPYKKHLIDVVTILLENGYDGDLSIAGWLHDSIEDTTLTYSKIRSAFGTGVAELVFAVTDELGRNRKERKDKTYPKIRAHGEDAVILKLADRIANIEHSQRMGNVGSTEMYKKEHTEFCTQLYFDAHKKAAKLWERYNRLFS